MKAAVCTAYGEPGVVRVREVPTPSVGPNEILIRIGATTVSSADARIRASRFPSGLWLPARLFLGLTRPRKPILGTEMAGVIEAIGASVTRYRPGDRVFAFSGAGMGCHAEFKTMPEDGPVARMPAGFTLEEAAAISFGGTTALYFLRDVARLERGERLLVNGASGAVGTAAVQLARHFGAHVTAVCSAGNAGLVRSLGADAVIDYGAADFANIGERWDVILDAVGNAPFVRCRPALNENGRLLQVVAGLGGMLMAPFQSLRRGVTVAAGAAPDRAQDIADLKALCDGGALRPVIDSRYPFDRIAEAHARTDSGRKIGSVVVMIGEDGSGDFRSCN
jgi:NADPH:quinone reductase-like Zn-dependent oxidoreductase